MGASVPNEASFNRKALSIRWVREDVRFAGSLHLTRLLERIGQLPYRPARTSNASAKGCSSDTIFPMILKSLYKKNMVLVLMLVPAQIPNQKWPHTPMGVRLFLSNKIAHWCLLVSQMRLREEPCCLRFRNNRARVTDRVSGISRSFCSGLRNAWLVLKDYPRREVYMYP